MPFCTLDELCSKSAKCFIFLKKNFFFFIFLPFAVNSCRVDRYSTRGVDLPKSEAQSRSIEMVKAYAEADQVGAGVDSRGF